MIPLHPNEFRLLVYMSLTAMDADNPPRYFGARVASAVALGRMIPDEPSTEDPTRTEVMRVRARAFEAVKIATRGLVDLGAIRRLKNARTGQRAEYGIMLDVIASQRTAAYKKRIRGGDSAHPSGGDSAPLEGGTQYPKRGGLSLPPRSTEEDGGTTGGITITNASTLRAPVDNSKQKQVTDLAA